MGVCHAGGCAGSPEGAESLPRPSRAPEQSKAMATEPRGPAPTDGVTLSLSQSRTGSEAWGLVTPREDPQMLQNQPSSQGRGLRAPRDQPTHTPPGTSRSSSRRPQETGPAGGPWTPGCVRPDVMGPRELLVAS